jgi:hypothetical protein
MRAARRGLAGAVQLSPRHMPGTAIQVSGACAAVGRAGLKASGVPASGVPASGVIEHVSHGQRSSAYLCALEAVSSYAPADEDEQYDGHDGLSFQGGLTAAAMKYFQ